MTCGCCVEACPQYARVELSQHTDETDEAFAERQTRAYDESFVGAAVISQAMLFNEHPTGQMNAGERLGTLMGPGGLQVCGNAQNCVKVCPKEIPLTESIAAIGRAVTIHSFASFFAGKK